MLSNYISPDERESSGRPRFDDSVSQLIRSAEKFISLHKFTFAEDQLNLARTLDPNNAYIWAIQERLHTMKDDGGSFGNFNVGAMPDAGSDSSRYLSVTVGSEFNGGFKSADAESRLSSKDLQARIRQLTTVAEDFLDKGSYENAFDSLMKAYLLDPVSPYVVSCEKVVLPAWESSHKPGKTINSFASKTTDETKGGKTDMGQIPEKQLSNDELKRMEALKVQKEQERQTHERALWRQASSPLKVMGSPTQSENNKPRSQQPDGPKQGGLFNKLKLGKLLG